MSDDALFHGIAVVIDDEIHKETASVQKICNAIKAAGCHVVLLNELPDETGVGNLREVAFVVLDWKLWGTQSSELADGETVELPESVIEEYEERTLDFLRNFKKVRFAPVFIFTDEDVNYIKERLDKHKELYDESDPSHIVVMAKGEVAAIGLFDVLAKWMKDAPSVYVLKKWERAYERAKNQLFLDFYTKSTLWPLIVWKSFKDDSAPPAALVGDLIGRNLTSRLMFDCNLEPFFPLLESLDKNSESYKNTVHRVLEGERFLAAGHLDDNSFRPGDIFQNNEEFFVNIRPECDCIPKGNDKLDNLDLYLLKGTEKPFSSLNYNEKYGLILEQDNEAIIFPIYDGKALCFKFRKLTTKKIKDIGSKRIGRLLPPFLTRLQQRYSAYLQRPGLSRLPDFAIPLPVASPGTSSIATGTAVETPPGGIVEVDALGRTATTVPVDAPRPHSATASSETGPEAEAPSVADDAPEFAPPSS